MNNRIAIVLLVLCLPAAAQAETMYVKERQAVALRDGVTPESQSLKNVATGVSLEVVERTATHIKVRLNDGTEGWISAALLTEEKPTEFKILAAETKLKQAESEAARLKAELGKMQARLTQAQQAQQSPPAEKPEQKEPEAAPTAGIKPFSVDLLWIGISFAMLGIGFVAGVAWLRERTRRKLGGMHIRVS
jgi:uncharacterized protein YgiM (DUF1202 family)